MAMTFYCQDQMQCKLELGEVCMEKTGRCAKEEVNSNLLSKFASPCLC